MFRTKTDDLSQEIHIVFKLPPTNYIRHLSKLGCLYVHEVLWYSK